MPNATASRVRTYLDELERALSGLPKDRRNEIVRDIRSHIDVALAERGEPTAADVEQVLEELGTPQEIAEAAYAELPPRRAPGIAGRDIAAVVLLLVGGFLFLIGWVVGVILLWVSDTWSTRDKVVATLLVPGGLLTPFLFTGLAALTTVTSCSGSQPEVVTTSGSANTASVAISHCSSAAGAGQGVVIFTWVTLAIAVIGPIYTATMLIRAARRVS